MRALPGLLSCLLLSSAITSAAGQQDAAVPAQAEPQATQTLTVTVTHRDHRPVTGLRTEDFTLYEDGQKQSILSVTSDVPACIGVIVDKSGSMRGKHDAIASAMAGFMAGGNPGNQAFVVLFNDDPMLEQDFTRDAALIERAIARANARGGTAMYDAIIASVDHLAENKTCGKRVLMIVGDGEDNESRKSLEYTLHALQTAGNPLVYGIALPHPNGPSNRGRRVLEALTGPNGGATFFAGDSGEVRKIALKIAEEIRSQYSISYARTKTGRPNVKIEAHSAGQKDLTVRVGVASELNLPAVAAAAQSRGSACISGAVLDGNKRPVAGMQIEAWPVFSPNSYPQNSYPSIATDESGKFKLAELQPGEYLLYTKNESAGYPSTKTPFYRNASLLPNQALEKCSDVTLRLGPKAAKLKVHAVDANTGEPLDRFTLSFRRDSGEMLVLSRLTQGQEIMVPPHKQLTVTAWSYRYPRNQPVVITTPDPEAVQELTVKLPQRTQSSVERERQ